MAAHDQQEPTCLFYRVYVEKNNTDAVSTFAVLGRSIREHQDGV